jgi:SET and MYND domain-containing protein 4
VNPDNELHSFDSHPALLLTEETQLTDEERWIGSLLLRQVQMLQFNAHEVAELQMASPSSLEGVKSVFMGAAVYPTLSLFNHSCEPSIVRY